MPHNNKNETHHQPATKPLPGLLMLLMMCRLSASQHTGEQTRLSQTPSYTSPAPAVLLLARFCAAPVSGRFSILAC
jgi:hypothetical protein